ncbi:MAG TPA: methylated-DNA--[protein]-cysteine S-methyltransferase [Candidatus Alistipes merdigallinarum]|nr:methylated-DNA--[protein]-cysteine S-methyltransferase [Candidatus Alistipes merdigallinarum]
MSKEELEIIAGSENSFFPRLCSVLERCLDGRVSWIDAVKSCGIDPVCFRSLFKSWAGVDPERFAEALTPVSLREKMKNDTPEPDLFSSTSDRDRHGSASRIDIVPVPTEVVSDAAFVVRYACYPTAFGRVLLASTSVGICFAGFVDTDEASLPVELQRLFPRATFVLGSDEMHHRALSYFNEGTETYDPVCLHLKGTPFQLDVWRQLLRIPRGSLTTYGALARQIGAPLASRAVGGAVGSNPVACLIPCHRVIRSSGALGGYHWGVTRKFLMLGKELIGPVVR